jgi:methionine aminopeptidase
MSVVRDYAGHGVGKLFHSDPAIPHYAGGQTHGVMKPGHVFTIEPMINQGTSEIKLWPDKWTVVHIAFDFECRQLLMDSDLPNSNTPY